MNGNGPRSSKNINNEYREKEIEVSVVNARLKNVCNKTGGENIILKRDGERRLKKR